MSSVVSQTSHTSAPPVIDVGALLAPIPGAARAGENLKFAGLHDDIRHARRADDALGQGDWVRETKAADWGRAARLAADALANQTKDLQVCAWMAEALVKLHGFAGLRDSLRVMRGLHEEFWEDLFPEVEDGDLEWRANAVSWMERQTAAALKEAPLTDGGLSYINWEQSNALNVGPEVDPDTAEERRQRAAAEGKTTSEDWLKAKQATPRAFYETAHATLAECQQEALALDATLDGLYGNDAPSLGELKKSMEAVAGVIERILKEKRLAEPDAEGGAAVEAGPAGPGGNGDHPAPAAAAAHAAPPAAPGAAAQGALRTRQDAVRRLAEVAEFFRQTEPHSPVAYLVERAVRWSGMPLEAWLESVIKDESVLTSLRETLGVDGAPEKG
jgi:type VI secretion system protein ImpA